MDNHEDLVKELINCLDKFKKFGKGRNFHDNIKHGEHMVLNIVKRETENNSSGIKVSTISKLLGVTPPNITQIIGGLEEQGYIIRSMDKNDRRAVRVKLTDAGEEKLKKSSKAFYDNFKKIVDVIGVEDSKDLVRILNKITTHYNTEQL